MDINILKIIPSVIGFFNKRLFINENIETRLFKKTDFSFIIERDIEQINDLLSINDIKNIDYELLCNFFKYPDIKEFIEKIYASNQSNPLGFFDINNIYFEFGQLVIKYFKLENDTPRNFSTKLLDILIEGCNDTLTKLNDDGVIQSQNALFNYDIFIKQYRKIQVFHKSLEDYKSIPDYLSRKVCSAEDYNSSRFLFSTNLESILDVIEKNKHISLLSDGGMGKTTELKQIAYHYSQYSNTYYPIFVTLNKYTTKNLSEYFPSYWELIPETELLVILDGFDEIQRKKIRGINSLDGSFLMLEQIRDLLLIQNNI